MSSLFHRLLIGLGLCQREGHSASLRGGQSGACVERPDITESGIEVVRSADFVAERAWAALDIASMNGISTRLHWTNQPYQWHINDGQEVFVVLSGQVRMGYRHAGREQAVLLEAGDIFHAGIGAEHMACPLGVARVLVIESAGSV